MRLFVLLVVQENQTFLTHFFKSSKIINFNKFWKLECCYLIRIVFAIIYLELFFNVSGDGLTCELFSTDF